MKTLLCSCLFAALAYFVFPLTINAQSPTGKRLFERDEVLEITLSGNIRELLNDRSETPQYHAINITCKNEDSTETLLTAEAKTRGHFRKLSANCLYPPLLLHFSKSDTLNASVFKEQDKVKLVMPCQGDEYIIREWLVYKLYNLVTPKSFRARLVKVKLDDTKNKKKPLPFYGILLEEEKQMANRNGLAAITRKMKPEQAEPDAFLKMAVFEYLVGNTDWSVQYLQNIKLLAADSNAVAIAVPYDFDHAGIVNAPYAKPAEELEMGSVRERRYRGYCMEDIKKFDAVIALYNELKKDIYSLYTDCPLLDDKYKKATLKYLDDFYATINNPVTLKKEFGYPCNKNGTGNVVIKGLREE